MSSVIGYIYAIVNAVTGRRYIGSTVDTTKRWSWHRTQLNAGRHHNRHLQASWRRHGWASFEFVVIERVSVAGTLVHREQYHLDVFKPNVYNTGPCADNALRGTKRTADWVDALRRRNQGNTYALGKKRNRVGVEKSAASRRGKKQPVSQRVKRVAAWARWRASQTHCPNGHDWASTAKYYYRADGSIVRRECKACRREQVSQKWQQYKSDRGPFTKRPITDSHRAALRAAWRKRGGGYWQGKKFSEAHLENLKAAWARRKARQQTEVA